MMALKQGREESLIPTRVFSLSTVCSVCCDEECIMADEMSVYELKYLVGGIRDTFLPQKTAILDHTLVGTLWDKTLVVMYSTQ